MKMAVLWVVAPCSLVEGYQRFRHRLYQFSEVSEVLAVSIIRAIAEVQIGVLSTNNANTVIICAQMRW
jgi:hypothetical protein